MVVWICKGEQHEGEIPREHEKTSGGDMYTHYFDCDGGFMGYTYIKTYQIVHLK